MNKKLKQDLMALVDSDQPITDSQYSRISELRLISVQTANDLKSRLDSVSSQGYLFMKSRIAVLTEEISLYDSLIRRYNAANAVA